MATVDIGSNSYETYADVDQADEYLAAEAGATAWRALTGDDGEDTKARALVSATRLIDRQQWPGERDEDDQTLAWPRSGTGVSGVVDDEVPQLVIDASIVLASLIVAGVDVTSVPSTASGRVKRQRAGSVEIEYFGDVGISGTRLPLQVHEMLAPLFGYTGLGGARPQGTDACSDFRYGYDPSGPL